MTQPQPQPLDVDAIEQRANNATDGPWWNDSHEIYVGEPGIPAMSTWLAETCNVDLPDAGAANGEFIAAARADVPALVDEVRRLRAELAGMTDLRDRAIAKQDQLRAELTRRRAEDLTLRGILAPADGPRQVPMALGDSVAPAVEWLRAELAGRRDQVLTEAAERLRTACPTHGTAPHAFMSCQCAAANDLLAARTTTAQEG